MIDRDNLRDNFRDNSVATPPGIYIPTGYIYRGVALGCGDCPVPLSRSKAAMRPAGRPDRADRGAARASAGRTKGLRPLRAPAAAFGSPRDSGGTPGQPGQSRDNPGFVPVVPLSRSAAP